MLALILSALFTAALSHSHHYHYSDPPPPAQDQCKSVNASEPRECPNTIGPPCPPCYTNFAQDYQPGDDVTFSSSQRSLINEFMQWYLDWWPANYPPTKTTSGYDLFLGSGGRGNIFLRVYMKNQNKTLLNTATEYVQHAISLLPSTNRQTSGSYMYGNVGVWTLQSVIDDINHDTTSMNKYLNYISETFKSVNTAIVDGNSRASNGINVNNDCTLDSGLSGMLYNALLLNTYYNKEIIDIQYIVNLVYHLLDIGIQTGKSLNTDYIQYESFTGCYLYGPGHGSTGIIKSVYSAYRMYPDQLASLFTKSSKYYAALKNTIDFYSSIQLDDGNIPTNTQGACENHYGSDNDARVQWCHGAPGFVNIFLESSILFKSLDSSAASKYFTSGMRALNSTWDRGLLVKGTMFCHGIGGNINMLQEAGYLLKEMNETELSNQAMYRAKQFILWTLSWNNIDKTRIYDSNEGYSMYQGNFAIPMVYIAAMQQGWPFNEPVCQPGWNLCI